MVAFSKQSCSVFWLKSTDNMDLPGSIKGKLGGPSQRRLATSITSSVLQCVRPFLIILVHSIASSHLVSCIYFTACKRSHLACFPGDAVILIMQQTK